jgi:adenosylmethionine-8-amino-7-oxononanoate aminotransferase
MECLAAVETLLATHAGEVVAVVVEPLVQGAAGMIVHPEGYLRGLRELSRRYGTLLIADEVAVGFGRTGTLFACEQEGVVPDFLCLGKGITGGYLPLAATLTHDEIYRAFYGTARDGKTFYHGHTYGGNPLGSAVALASLRVFDDEQTLHHLGPKIARMGQRLEELAALEHVGNVRRKGLIAGVELVADKASKTPFDWEQQVGARVCARARTQGLLIRPLGDVLVIMPPLAIQANQLDAMFDVLIDCVRGVTEGP